MRPKSCKSAKNQQKKKSYTTDFAISTRQNNQILIETALGDIPRARAPSNSNVDFLLSQVSHTSPKTRIYYEKTTTPNLYVTVYFPTSFLYFSSLKANKP